MASSLTAVRLTERQRQLLAFCELRADMPQRDIARALQLREHVVRYELQQLAQRRVLLGRIPVVNPELLGFNEYTMYLSLSTQREKVRAKAVGQLCAIPQVTWFAEAGGDFHYFLSLCIRHVGEIRQIIGGLGERFGRILYEKDSAAIHSFSAFGRTYLAAGAKRSKILSYAAPKSGHSREFDDTDLRVIGAVCSGGYKSFRELARDNDIPLSTFLRRVELLRESGVICGFVHHIDTRVLGIQGYKFLLYSRGMDTATRTRFYSLCQSHPNIVTLIESIGPWDFELRVEVPADENASLISRVILDKFGSTIGLIRMIPLFGFLKSSNFPKQLVVARKAA